MKRPSVTVSKETVSGTAHMTVTLRDGLPYEVLMTVGKAGSDINALAEAIGRLACLCLRTKPNWTVKDRLNNVIYQLSGIGGRQQYGVEGKIRSLPDALATALREVLTQEDEEVITSTESVVKDASFSTTDPHQGIPGADLCPSCGMCTLLNIEGCESCHNCGHSAC